MKAAFFNMKKLFILLSLLFPVLATAAPVEEATCRKVAAEFLKSKKAGVEMAQLKLVNTEPAVKSSTSAPAYYVYTMPSKGFVIVSGDDSVEPILGYSTENRFAQEGHAPNFESWMGMWEKIIAANRKHFTKASSKVSEAWSNFTAPSRTTSGPAELLIETALWDQGSPYNLLCPKDEGGYCVTGCTATALAIIMRHQKWPDCGVGTLPGYITNGIAIPDIKLGEKYDWDNMPLIYDSSASEAQKMAVATIMYHLGVMMQSNYSSSGTGSHSFYIANTITKYMKYDESEFFAYADFYKDGEWVELIKSSIQDNCPVHYSGFAEDNAGHAFVADGYDNQNKIHINFGWSGQDNGYFAFPEFSDFTIGHIALCFLKKKQEGTPKANIMFDTANGSRGLVVTSNGKPVTNFEVGKPFDVKAGSFFNYSPAQFEGELGVGKFNRNGEMVEIIGSDEASIGGLTETGYYITDLEYTYCTLTTPIRVGDVLRPMFRAKGEKTWTACPYDRTLYGFTGEVEIADNRTIEESTTITFDVVQGIAEVSVKDGVDIKLLNAAGAEVNDGIGATDTGIIIDVKAVGKGTYKLCLTKDYENVEMEVKL